MFGGAGGPRGMMEREVSKPKNAGETLKRFGSYFRPFWPVLLLAVALVVVSTWTQVTAPELLGQAVDCYINPASSNSFAGLPGAPAPSTSSSTCWVDPSATSTMTNEAKIAGLGRIVLRMVGLYLLGAIATGLTFFSMAWAGQHMLKALRVEVFK